jgi:hypothetical protein
VTESAANVRQNDLPVKKKDGRCGCAEASVNFPVRADLKWWRE